MKNKSIHIPGHMWNEILNNMGYCEDEDDVVIDIDPMGYLMVFKNNEWIWDQKHS
jgi:hypothetical protein